MAGPEKAKEELAVADFTERPTSSERANDYRHYSPLCLPGAPEEESRCIALPFPPFPLCPVFRWSPQLAKPNCGVCREKETCQAQRLAKYYFSIGV